MVKLQSAKSTSSSSIDKVDKVDKVDKTEKDKREKLTDEIKEYLKSRAENTKLNNEIKDMVQIQNTYIDYIIYKLPNN